MPPKRQRVSDDINKILGKRSFRSHQDALTQILDGNILPAELFKLRRALKKHISMGIDIGYLKTVLFPEQYSYDIPFPLSSVSFAKFTDKQDLIINSGPTGSGMLIWYPKINCGPQIFIAEEVPTVDTDGIGLSDITKDVDKMIYKWKPGPWIQSYQYFTQTALVAAALTIQYIGKVELEAGIMVGGHIYGIDPKNLTSDEIENAQWVTRARPGEGLRFVYLPRDASDFEFYNTQSGRSGNTGANKSGDEKYSLGFKGGDGSNGNPYWVAPSTTAGGAVARSALRPPQSIPDNQQTVEYLKNANMIAIYWTGMEPRQNWLRVDIAKKFDGIPISKYRDILEMTRPIKQFDEKKTFNVLNTLCQAAPLGGHTLKEVDQIVDRLQHALPNVGYVMENGGIQNVSTLTQLADILEHPNLEEKGLAGASSGEIGRIYHYY